VVLVTAAALTIVGTVGNTSARVAEHNIERWQATGKLDTFYLATLPEDAVPAIEDSPLPEGVTTCILGAIPTTHAPGHEDSLAVWNLARQRAEQIRAHHPPPTDCRLATR